MILLAAVAVGLLLRAMSGRRFADLSSVGLRGEGLLLVMLVLQAIAPALRLAPALSAPTFYVWAATFPAMIFVAWTNRNQPGMTMLALGMAMNMVVIYLNGGMPVAAEAVQAIKGSSLAVVTIPAGDFVHVEASGRTALPWLADVIPVLGPQWIRSVASPGDCLLGAGIAAFIACAGSVNQSRSLR